MKARAAIIPLWILTAVLASTTPVRAAINTTSNPSTLASAISDTPGLVVGSAFLTIPPRGTPHGVSDIAVMGFPRAGSTYAVLTTGDAAQADVSGAFANVDNGGTAVRGPNDRDVSILRIDLQAPEDANCLIFDFQFLANEGDVNGSQDDDVASRAYDLVRLSGGYPWNDAFVAELNASTWTTQPGGAVVAPKNFAFDNDGNAISVTTAQFWRAWGSRANYNTATQLIEAATALPVGDANGLLPGNNSLYISIFEGRDRAFDAAAFVDGLRTVTVDDPGTQCASRTNPILDASPTIIDLLPGASTGLISYTAALRDEAGTPLPGRAVEFYRADEDPASWPPLCTAVTDQNGVAACGPVVRATHPVSAYHAIFNGDGSLLPSFRVGRAVRLNGEVVY